jgi:hypothetical protein
MSWIDELKPGDVVAVRIEYGSRHVLHTVARLTTTQVILDNGDRFRRATGGEITSSAWNRSILEFPTEKIRAEVLRRIQLDRLKHAKWHELSDHQLARGVAILDEKKPS